MCRFSFPLFAPAMYDKLGVGWGNSLLAFLTLGLKGTSPVLLWYYGEKLRAMSWRGLDEGKDEDAVNYGGTSLVDLGYEPGGWQCR